MDKLLVIHTNVVLKADTFARLARSIQEQRKTGVILLPSFCKAVLVPEDVEIKIVNGGDAK